MIQEFKTFILRGNVMDLAIGVIIGATFSSIVTSLITDVITPLILSPAMELAHVKDLEQLRLGGSGAIKIGKFLAAIINFILTAFILFLIIKGINKTTKKKKEDEAVAPTPILSNEEILLTEIRDLLKK